MGLYFSFLFYTSSFGWVWEAKVTESIQQWISYWMIERVYVETFTHITSRLFAPAESQQNPMPTFSFESGNKTGFSKKNVMYTRKCSSNLTSLDVCLTERLQLGFESLHGESVACWTGSRIATTTQMSSSRKTEWVTAMDIWMTRWESIFSNFNRSLTKFSYFCFIDNKSIWLFIIVQQVLHQQRS